MPEPAPRNDVTQAEPLVELAATTSDDKRFPDDAGDRRGDRKDGPTALGRYRRVETLGEGGMGVVYRAHDPELGRDVALKVLHPHAAPDAAARARLRKEARALAEVSHPNVVQVYDVGEDRGSVYVGMELVPGIDLRRWLDREPRPWRAALELVLAAGWGLAAAHARGLVHRDFKPANVLVGDDGRARVVDFGLASLTAEEPRTDVEAPTGSRPGTTTLTQSGVVMGTPVYMAPEQYRGHAIDARTDQFAFCIAAWEAVYGVRPFEGLTTQELALAKERGEVRPPPRDRGVPRRVAAVLRRGLRRDPVERWPDMATLLAALERAARPRRGLAWGTGAAVLAVGAVVAAERLAPSRGAAACPPAAERLAGVWDDARRDELRRAFEGSGLAYADTTWPRVQDRLDEHAAQWSAAHDEACAARAEGSDDPDALDLRMLCLADRRAELGSLVDVLAELGSPTPGRETAVRNAVHVAAELRSPAACGDPRGARAEDGADPAEAEALRRDLLRAESLGKVARYDEALALAEATIARTAEGSMLRAEALLVAGAIHKGKGAPDDAHRLLADAAWLALSQGRDDVAARAAIELVEVEGPWRARHEEALEWSRHAQAAIERLGGDRLLEARRLTALGHVEIARGNMDAALAAFEGSLALVAETFGEGHPRLASARSDVGNALVRAGRFDEALAATREALAAGEQAFGATHPEVGLMHGRVATAWMRQGDYDQAAASSQRAIEILGAALGPDHHNVASFVITLGQIEQRRGRLPEAEAAFRRALPAVAGTINEAILHGALCDLAREQGDDVAALSHARRSRELRESLLAPDDAMVAVGLLGEGLALSRVDRHDEALATLERARAIDARRPLTPLHRTILEAYDGRARLRAGRPDEALPRLERALAEQERLGVEPIDRADVRFHVAQALWALGRQDEARAQLAVADQELAPLGARADHRRRPIREWIEAHAVGYTFGDGIPRR